MRGEPSQIIITFFDIFPVVTLRAGEPEKPLLKDRIGTIPECWGKAEAALPVTKPKEAILSPTVGSAARMVM